MLLWLAEGQLYYFKGVTSQVETKYLDFCEALTSSSVQYFVHCFYICCYVTLYCTSLRTACKYTCRDVTLHCTQLRNVWIHVVMLHFTVPSFELLVSLFRCYTLLLLASHCVYACDVTHYCTQLRTACILVGMLQFTLPSFALCVLCCYITSNLPLCSQYLLFSVPFLTFPLSSFSSLFHVFAFLVYFFPTFCTFIAFELLLFSFLSYVLTFIVRHSKKI